MSEHSLAFKRSRVSEALAKPVSISEWHRCPHRPRSSSTSIPISAWSADTFRQLAGDSGAGATLGDFKSRVFGIGPQIGYKFKANDTTDGYVNLKDYYEFGAENCAEGWNVC
ncbi:transporter [Rhizobium mongolense]|uniref:Uncharacterized protein n=1 Tax=Rhizobium mongolense TaxID=57676 RepID=A0A7W6WCA7_9HYPH|nr:transporter [Rhizobium mongolense]MBB4272585.1 hypothetical protein [Rhizobium mongolense]